MRVLLTTIIYGYLWLVGICIGSFCNVLVYRIPKGINIAKGRSFCPQCGHTLAAKDLVPIFSWLALRGRCRYCGGAISARYPLVELMGGIFAVLAWAAYGMSYAALIAFLAACILMTVSLIDWDTQEIPDSLVLALAVVAVLSAVLTRDVPIVSRLIGLAAASVPMMLVNVVRRTGFGGGDIKLCVAAGFLLGWQRMLVGLFIALLLGGGYGAYLLMTKRKARTDHFAFGPFLSAGIYLSLLCGGALLNWYLGTFWL